jgi:hypothetical protein
VEYNTEKPEDPLEEADLIGDRPSADDDAPADDNEGDRFRGGENGGLFPGFLDASAN